MHQSSSRHLKSPYSRSRIIFVIIVNLSYILFFVPLYHIFGAGVGALSLLPLVFTGWLLGVRGGLLIGIFHFFLHLPLYWLVGEPLVQAVFLSPGAYIGPFVSILTGSLRELLDRSKIQSQLLLDEREALYKEMRERREIERALQQTKDELESRVAERTKALSAVNQQLSYELAERKRIEEQITTSLKQKEVLLKEVHHRVKNNLQVISSLLYLQSSKIKDQEALEIFRDSQNRIRSMALIHEKLYQAKDITQIDLSSYLHSLIGYLFRSYGNYAAGIRLQVQAENVFLGIDLAMPCGLIINELVSNALKHAFPAGCSGEIGIEFSQQEHYHYRLCVRDNGVGVPANIDFENASTLGLQLVNTLVQQIEGTIQLQRNGGTAIIIHFAEGK